MNDSEYLALRQKAKDLRSNSPEEAISFLEAAFEAAKDDLLAIGSLLSDHYTLSNMHEAREEQLRFKARLFPHEPIAWTSLTEFLIFTKEDLDEAEEIAQQALLCAEKTGEYVRLCYNNFARIARKRENYKKLEECLRFLIDYQPQAGKRDIQYEQDFLVGIDEAKIDSGLLQKYKAICS